MAHHRVALHHPLIMFRHPLLVLGFLAVATASAQDSLFYRDGKTITGRVEEIGVELVRYRTASGDAQVLVVAEKRDLARIRLEGGQEFVLSSFSDDVPGSEAFLARRSILSADVIAPALNHAVVGYERWIARRTSLCMKAGYIGIGHYSEDSRTIRTSGALGKAGMKFILPRSRRRIPNPRDGHPLAGWYLKPELVISAWGVDEQYYYYYPNSYSTVGNNYVSAALNLTIGRQLILGEHFTFDISGGLGYGTQWKNGAQTSGLGDTYSYDRREYSYSHLFLGSRAPLTVSGGVMFGYLL